PACQTPTPSPQRRGAAGDLGRFAALRCGRARLDIAREELGVRGHRLHAVRDHVANAGDELVDLALGDQVDGRMVIAWQDVLAEHDLYPARESEHLVRVTEEAPAVPEQSDIVGELFGNAHVRAVLPKR